MNPLRIAFVVGALLIAGSTALLMMTFPGTGGLVARTFAATPLPDAEIQSRLESQGFSNIQGVQHNGNRVIVMATKDGKTGQLAVDPVTGNVIQDSDGDDNDDDD
jgi:hypothetical protein